MLRLNKKRPEGIEFLSDEQKEHILYAKKILIDNLISATIYGDTNNPIKWLIICPATGVKQSFYKDFALWFSMRGYTVVTFDYQGIGESRKEDTDFNDISASDYSQQDIPIVINYVKSKSKFSKILLLGHSLGGQLIGLASNNHLVDGIVLISSQSGYWKLWPKHSWLKYLLIWYILFPLNLKIYGYFKGKIYKMADLPPAFTKEWIKWSKSKNYLFDHVPFAKLSFDRVRTNIVAYSFEDDSYAPKKSVDWLSKQFSNSEIKRKHLNGKLFRINKIGHFGMFNSKCSQTVWHNFLLEFNNLTKM